MLLQQKNHQSLLKIQSTDSSIQFPSPSENTACNVATLIQSRIKDYLPSCGTGKLRPFVSGSFILDKLLNIAAMVCFVMVLWALGLFLGILPGFQQLQKHLCTKTSCIPLMPGDALNMLCTLKTRALLVSPFHSPSSLEQHLMNTWASSIKLSNCLSDKSDILLFLVGILIKRTGETESSYSDDKSNLLGRTSYRQVPLHCPKQGGGLEQNQL